MTSISAHSFNPRNALQDQLLSQISSGKIKSSDKDALSSALDDIDSSLKGQPSGSGGPPSPGDIQSKISDLISGEVKSGKLTSDQASELKDLFSATFDKNGPQGSPLSAGSSTSSKNVDDIISEFLKSIQKSQSTNYGTNVSDASSQLSVLFDYTA